MYYFVYSINLWEGVKNLGSNNFGRFLSNVFLKSNLQIYHVIYHNQAQLLHNYSSFSYDEEWVELVVLGRPSRPEGPLEVANITAEGCKLRWKPPADDGGMPIQEYEIEMLCPKTKKWIRKGKVRTNIFIFSEVSLQVFIVTLKRFSTPENN